MLDLMMTLVVPLTLGLVAVYAACRRVDVYDALIQGAGEGLGTLARIIPSLVGLMTAVYMLRASGALDLAAQALAPLLDRVGVPAELLPLMLVRPISGSAALGVGAELITSSGPDSYVGRVAAVAAGVYPPGLACLVPGEEIQGDAAAYLLQQQAKGFALFGVEEGRISCIKED